jgi:hypothetical protein
MPPHLGVIGSRVEPRCTIYHRSDGLGRVAFQPIIDEYRVLRFGPALVPSAIRWPPPVRASGFISFDLVIGLKGFHCPLKFSARLEQEAGGDQGRIGPAEVGQA